MRAANSKPMLNRWTQKIEDSQHSPQWLESKAGRAGEKCRNGVGIEEGKEDERNDEGKKCMMKKTKNVC